MRKNCKRDATEAEPLRIPHHSSHLREQRLFWEVCKPSSEK